MRAVKHDLAKIHLFAGLPQAELEQLASIVQVRTVAKKGVVFWEGDAAQGLYYIKSGAVQLSKSTAEGKEHILQIFGPGQVLAEAVLFSDQPYPATAVAVEDTVLYFVANGAMEELIRRHPGIALYVIRVLSQRLLIAQEKLKRWAFAPAESRIAALLLDLARDHGRQVAEGTEIDMELTHSRLGALAGLTRETVSRALGDLRSRSLVDTSRRRLIILDREGLEIISKE